MVAVVSAAVLGACAQPGYDAHKIQRELERAGVPAAQAKCVTDGFENPDEFDVRQLASHSDPTSKEEEKTRSLLVSCGVSLQQPR